MDKATVRQNRTGRRNGGAVQPDEAAQVSQTVSINAGSVQRKFEGR